MSKIISLAEQMETLFQHGQERGLPVTYRAIAHATGETANNLFRIRHGQNINPGLRTLSALVAYFNTDLGYFSCQTKEDCLNYLKRNNSVTSDARPASALTQGEVQAFSQRLQPPLDSGP